MGQNSIGGRINTEYKDKLGPHGGTKQTVITKQNLTYMSDDAKIKRIVELYKSMNPATRSMSTFMIRPEMTLWEEFAKERKIDWAVSGDAVMVYYPDYKQDYPFWLGVSFGEYSKAWEQEIEMHELKEKIRARAAGLDLD